VASSQDHERLYDNSFRRMRWINTIIITFLFHLSPAQAQDSSAAPLPQVDYTEKTTYEIGDIVVYGNKRSNARTILKVAGLRKGMKLTVPGIEIKKAIQNLWRQKLFTEISITKERVVGDVVFLAIHLQEHPRLASFSFTGIKKSERELIQTRVKPYLMLGGILTEASKLNAHTSIAAYFIQKGYPDVVIDHQISTDDTKNTIQLVFDIDRRKKVKIDEIRIEGNVKVSDQVLRKQLKNTREKGNILRSSKYISSQFQSDQAQLIDYYHRMGYRDARITGDSLWRSDGGGIHLAITIEEGQKYFIRKVDWKGNSIFSDEFLHSIFGLHRGDTYNQELVNQRLTYNADGRDISSLYMDIGFLFFKVEAIETGVEKDSIDLEIRIQEGSQATIDQVSIVGNDRTHEHVIRRELRTKPGQTFSRQDLIRSQRQIMNLGFFDPEKLDMNTSVNPTRGTVDIQYEVAEKGGEKFELSAGYQPETATSSGGLIGTLGVTFNNFSVRNLLEGKRWDPIPQGDGQQLSLRAQTNGLDYQSYNASFTDPWLGGKKPNAMTLSGFYTQSTQFQDLDIEDTPQLSMAQLTAGIGSRLTWPDDYFASNTSLNLQFINLKDYPNVFLLPDGTSIADGKFNNFYFQQTIARSTIAEPIFPRSGSSFSLSAQFTPPYSLFSNKDYSGQTVQEHYRFIEYHKWKFTSEWYQPLFGKSVLKISSKMGFLGQYTARNGASPFERFAFASEPLSSPFTVTGQDQIYFRGYGTEDFPAQIDQNGQISGSTIFNKFSLELRYPISLHPNATIYALAFADAGNAWTGIKSYNPFDLKRSAGLGMRIFLPMFGTLGFDYGIGFDKPSVYNQPDFKWTDLGRFQIILGFEPD